ncbi:MAG: lipopolysaccharide transport periplasmic protein LptA [Zoogloeaceae bacterium]|nr:lipopolysaccharide transport periplasmic protein LptA [Zoogloeaceae bacterium]
MKNAVATTALMIGLIVGPGAHAAKSDREQPVNIEADRVIVDDRNKTHTFEGSVILTQGSLEIKGDKMVVTQGADGFQTGVATGSPNRLATFRQRRDGSDIFIEGEAERIEYDTRAERARLFKQARVSSAGDVVTGDFIEYDALTEKYSATNQSGGSGGGRVRAVIQPRSSGEGSQ